jgi:hypothetical protein
MSEDKSETAAVEAKARAEAQAAQDSRRFARPIVIAVARPETGILIPGSGGQGGKIRVKIERREIGTLGDLRTLLGECGGNLGLVVTVILQVLVEVAEHSGFLEAATPPAPAAEGKKP